MQEITFVSKHSNEDKEDVFKYELIFKLFPTLLYELSLKVKS